MTPILWMLCLVVGAIGGIAVYIGDPPESDTSPADVDWFAAYDRTKRWLVVELRDDWSAMRRYSVTDYLHRAVEMVLALALIMRTGIHIAAYLIANPSGEPNINRLASLDPIAAKRPLWNDLSARVSCCVLGVWMIETTAGIRADAHLALAGVTIALAGVLVADPLAGLIAYTMETQNGTKQPSQ